MYIAVIGGWNEVMTFSEDEEKARKLAVDEKHKLCPDEPIGSWTWEQCHEYFGAFSQEIKEGTVINK